MNQNWDWVRSTYNPSALLKENVVDDGFRFPSCVANGLSVREKKALLQVYPAAYQRAEARLRRSCRVNTTKTVGT
jgi:hypothetical protein